MAITRRTSAARAGPKANATGGGSLSPGRAAPGGARKKRRTRATAGGRIEIVATSIRRMCTGGRRVFAMATATVAAKNRTIEIGTIDAARARGSIAGDAASEAHGGDHEAEEEHRGRQRDASQAQCAMTMEVSGGGGSGLDDEQNRPRRKQHAVQVQNRWVDERTGCERRPVRRDEPGDGEARAGVCHPHEELLRRDVRSGNGGGRDNCGYDVEHGPDSKPVGLRPTSRGRT